jgi:hypothetical protein
MLTIAVAFYDDRGYYPLLGELRHVSRPTPFWRIIAVQLASARKFFGDAARLVLSSNAQPGAEARPLLRRIGAEVVPVAFDHEPPPGYFTHFWRSFYRFDAVSHFAATAADDDLLLLIEPDCVWVADPGPLVATLCRTGTLTYDTGYTEDERILGTTRRRLTKLFAELSGRTPEEMPCYCGGEILGVIGERARKLMPVIDEVWQQCVQRFREGREKLYTDEAMLSYVF